MPDKMLRLVSGIALWIPAKFGAEVWSAASDEHEGGDRWDRSR